MLLVEASAMGLGPGDRAVATDLDDKEDAWFYGLERRIEAGFGLAGEGPRISELTQSSGAWVILGVNWLLVTERTQFGG